MATFIVQVSARGSVDASRYAGPARATSMGVAVRIGTPPGNGRGEHVNRRHQLTTFLAIPASNLDQTQRINVIINPSDTSQRVVTLGRLSLVKVERLFTAMDLLSYTSLLAFPFGEYAGGFSGLQPKAALRPALPSVRAKNQSKTCSELRGRLIKYPCA
jgi:hypothetical protein